MKKNKSAILVVLVTILLNLSMLLTFYMMNQQKERRKYLFGASYMTRGNPFFNILNEAIDEVVEEHGDILIVRDPSQNQQRQNEQILEMINEGIEVLFLCPVHKEDIKPALDACEAAGVIVINVDNAVEDREKVDAIIETDNYKAGVLCAQDMMKRTDSARIVIIGNNIQCSTIDREKVMNRRRKRWFP